MKPRSELSLSDDWATEQWLFEYCSLLYGPFDVDVAAAPWNHKVEKFYTKRDSGLVSPWGRRNWCNSPYSKGMKEAFTWRGRLFVEVAKSELSCHLLPHDTADGYWRRCVEVTAGKCLGISKHHSQLGTVIQTRFEGLTVEKTEINGRLSYRHRSGATGTARHSSALVVFAQPRILEPLEWDSPRSRIPTYRPSERLDEAA